MIVWRRRKKYTCTIDTYKYRCMYNSLYWQNFYPYHAKVFYKTTTIKLFMVHKSFVCRPSKGKFYELRFPWGIFFLLSVGWLVMAETTHHQYMACVCGQCTYKLNAKQTTTTTKHTQNRNNRCTNPKEPVRHSFTRVHKNMYMLYVVHQVSKQNSTNI